MNPIPLNDRGQYRYADFMAYLPEFLREEPDVVQLIQLMSDYINDAYRNIEDVEEFEFKLCVAEPKVSIATKKLNALREMFVLASGRGDKVNYLSVPRANVKSNAVFGKGSGYTPYYVDVSLDTVEDEITGIYRFDRNLGEKEDGDVVFVRYVNTDPVQVIPYYYSRNTHSLLRDTEGSTQDPFTDTPNTGSRMISFNVDDISSVSVRFGEQVNKNNYYEVFFTARITNVTSESSVQKVYFDADRVNEAADGIVIDYYGTEYVPQDTYHSTITFYGMDGWRWKDGFPSGMFYLKDSSGAKLATAEGTLGRNEELVEDPSTAMRSERYALASDAKYDTNTGLWEFHTCAALPQSDAGRFYLVDKTTGTCVGEFMLVPGQSVDGSFVSRMTSVWLGEGYADVLEISDKNVFLLNFPLYYDKGVPDYSTSKPLVRLDMTGNAATIPDWRAVYGKRGNPLYSALTAISTFVYCSEDRLSSDTGSNSYLGRNQFIIPYSKGLQLKVGDALYSNGTLWSGLNVVESIDNVAYWHTKHYDNPNMNDVTALAEGKLITMQNSLSDSIVDNSEVTLYTGVDMVFTAESIGSEVSWVCRTAGQLTDIFHINTPAEGFDPAQLNAFIEYRVEGDDITHAYRGRVVNAKDTGNGVSFNIEPPLVEKNLGTVAAATIYTVTNEGTFSKLGEINRISGNVIEATCERGRGDLYTNGIMYIWDNDGNYAFAGIGNDTDSSSDVEVLPLRYGISYSRGDVVYDPTTEKLYECTGNCILNEGDSLAKSDYFKLNTVTRAKTGYGKVYNKFMPYFGSVQSLDYGEGVNYDTEMSVATRPLYITKIAENRLKYGWEHREFLNYGTMMNMSGRERNGSVDIFSAATSDKGKFETEWDVVTSTLDKKAKWHITYPVIKRGTESTIPVDVDNPISVPAEYKGDYWEVTVASAGHGLVENSVVRVFGFGAPGELDINGYFNVHVADGDTISFRVPSDDSTFTATCRYITINETSSITYIGDYWMDVDRVTKIIGGDGFELTLKYAPCGIKHGDEITLVDLDADISPAEGERTEFSITILADSDASDEGIAFTCSDGAAQLEAQMDHEFQIRRSPSVGDYVYVTDRIGTESETSTMYRVNAGIWEEKEINDLAVPSVIVSKHNLMDISDTNPELALGDTLVIDSIIADGDNSAVVRMKDMLVHFTVDNAELINGRTMVYINKVTPSVYNGWHTVTEVISPNAFRIAVRFREGESSDGSGLNGESMTLREGRWYAYTVGGVDWDKISNQVTFSLNNTISDADGISVVTEKEHGLSVGDYVIVGSYGYIVGIDSDNASELDNGIACYRVSSVLSKFTLTLADSISGEQVSGSGLVNKCIARGVKVSDRMDDIGSLRNEYTMELATYAGAKYRFRKGDLVVALAQQNPTEIKTWRVVSNDSWTPVRAKRTLKISALDVYSYKNGDFDGAAVEDNQDALRYETFSDVDVAGFDDVYVAGYKCVSKANFTKPALDDMDTTRYAAAEYSSGEDFSNISPRHEMKQSFRGVPAMKYPLVEKIERLCYLRDAHVIDYELIGYLARFLGYDITAMAEDVRESNLYKTWRDKEEAIRETVANLPQYYALGGTKAGLNMLISAFGVIADAMTLWTDADHPYSELIPRETVVDRVESGDGGKWVPTPYIDIRVTNHAKYPQFAPSQSDIRRIKEQIQVFKPINVVFRDFVYRLIDEVKLQPSIAMAEITTSANLGAVGQTDIRIDYGPAELNNCSF